MSTNCNSVVSATCNSVAIVCNCNSVAGAIWTCVAISNPVISEHWPGNELSPVVSVIIIIVVVILVVIVIVIVRHMRLIWLATLDACSKI